MMISGLSTVMGRITSIKWSIALSIVSSDWTSTLRIQLVCHLMIFVQLSKLGNSRLTFGITDSKQKSILEEISCAKHLSKGYQICFGIFLFWDIFCLGGFLYIRLKFRYIRLCHQREYWDEICRLNEQIGAINNFEPEPRI